MVRTIKNQQPTFEHEKILWMNGYNSVAGIDEVGRGAFAGPLVAAGVIFPKNSFILESLLSDIRDSKLISASKRQVLSQKIKKYALQWQIITVDVEFINNFGVGKATSFAFDEIIKLMKPDFALLDAFSAPSFPQTLQKPLIHGDSLSISIASASIIAKVYRDELMIKYHSQFPDYNFKNNKGYGTEQHRKYLRQKGMCSLHRTSFNLSRFI